MPRLPRTIIHVYMRCATCRWVYSTKSYSRYGIMMAKDHVDCYPDHIVEITTTLKGDAVED